MRARILHSIVAVGLITSTGSAAVAEGPAAGGRNGEVSRRPQGVVRPAPRSVIGLTEFGGLNVLHEDFRMTGEGRLGLPVEAPRLKVVRLPRTGNFDERVAQARRGPLGNLKGDTLYHIAGTRLLIYVPRDVVDGFDLFTDMEHATGTASAAVGTRYGTNPDGLLVFIPASPQGWRWLARQQAWIDTLSVSYYDLFSTRRNRCYTAPIIRDITRQGRIVFVAAGNFEQAGVVSAPAGVPEAYQVGGVDREGRPLVPTSIKDIFAGGTPTRPYETGDRMVFPAASHEALSGPQDFGGTSGATPSTAGRVTLLIEHARHLLASRYNGVRHGKLAQAARGAKVPRKGPLADGDLSAGELTRILHDVAVPSTPANPLRYYHEGYGAIDKRAIARAKRVLAGTESLPARPDDDAQHERWEALRKSALQSVCF